MEKLRHDHHEHQMRQSGQRLEGEVQPPLTFGASHHRKPLRLTKIIPLDTRRSSTRGLPWLLGKKG